MEWRLEAAMVTTWGQTKCTAAWTCGSKAAAAIHGCLEAATPCLASSDSAPGRRNKARTTWGQTKYTEWRLSGRRRAASPLVRLLSDSSPKAEPRKNHHGRDERPYPKGQVACRRMDLRLESRSCDSWLPGGSHSMPGARPTPLRAEGTKRASALVPEDRHQAQNAVLTVLP